MDSMQILSVLSPGVMIKTQLSNLNTWIVNTILRVDKDCLEIPLIEEYLSSTILANDFIKCRFSLGEHEITLSCVVKDISFASRVYMTIKVMKVDVWKNIRGSERFDVNYLCKVKAEDKTDSISIVTNFSNTGAAVVCKDQWRTNSDIKLSVLTREQIIVDLYANIVRNRKTLDNKIEYGVRFINLTEDEKRKIDIIIDNLKEQEDKDFSRLCTKFRVSPKTYNSSFTGQG